MSQIILNSGFFSKVPVWEWSGKYGDDVDYNRTIGCDNAAMEGD